MKRDTRPRATAGRQSRVDVEMQNVTFLCEVMSFVGHHHFDGVVAIHMFVSSSQFPVRAK